MSSQRSKTSRTNSSMVERKRQPEDALSVIPQHHDSGDPLDRQDLRDMVGYNSGVQRYALYFTLDLSGYTDLVRRNWLMKVGKTRSLRERLPYPVFAYHSYLVLWYRILLVCRAGGQDIGPFKKDVDRMRERVKTIHLSQYLLQYLQGVGRFSTNYGENYTPRMDVPTSSFSQEARNGLLGHWGKPSNQLETRRYLTTPAPYWFTRTMQRISSDSPGIGGWPSDLDPDAPEGATWKFTTPDVLGYWDDESTSLGIRQQLRDLGWSPENGVPSDMEGGMLNFSPSTFNAVDQLVADHFGIKGVPLSSLDNPEGSRAEMVVVQYLSQTLDAIPTYMKLDCHRVSTCSRDQLDGRNWKQGFVCQYRRDMILPKTKPTNRTSAFPGCGWVYEKKGLPMCAPTIDASSINSQINEFDNRKLAIDRFIGSANVSRARALDRAMIG